MPCVQAVAGQAALGGGPDVSVRGAGGEGEGAPAADAFEGAVGLPGVAVVDGQSPEGSGPESSSGVHSERVDVVAAESVLCGEVVVLFGGGVLAPDAVVLGGDGDAALGVGAEGGDERALLAAVPGEGVGVAGSRQQAEGETSDQARQKGRGRKGAAERARVHGIRSLHWVERQRQR